MNVKQLVGTAMIAAVLGAGGITQAFAVSDEPPMIQVEQEQESGLQPLYEYVEQTTIRSYSGTYSIDPFKAKWNGSINVWFENYSDSDVKVVLRKKGWFGREEDIQSMTVSPDKAGGKHFTATVKKGGEYYVHLNTVDGDELYGELKIKDPDHENTV